MKIEININDRIVNFVKRVCKKESIIAGIFFSVIVASIIVYAAPITLPHTFIDGDLISASQVNANFQALQQKINEIDSQIQGVPTGTIVPFAGDSNSVPAGWKLCDGSEISRIDYAALFAVVSIKWGSGNMNDTFNLPDLRGRFLRGTDNGAGNDPDTGSRTRLFAGGNTGDAVGSYQLDDLKGHDHNVTVNVGIGCHSGADWCSTANWGSTTYTTTQSGGNETRPKNASVNYIIKY